MFDSVDFRLDGYGDELRKSHIFQSPLLDIDRKKTSMEYDL